MNDQQLYNTVCAWNDSWGDISPDYLARCHVELRTHGELTDRQRSGLQTIVKNNKIDPMDMCANNQRRNPNGF